MANHTLSQFPKDEQDDFADVCERYQRAVEEFDVVDVAHCPPDGNGGPLARRVRVTLRAESVVAEYDGGDGDSWITAFEEDLKTGSFN